MVEESKMSDETKGRGSDARSSRLSEKDPTLADLSKPLGYATGQFGKNHLGDRNEFLPTVHGFDEFFGNLYHLNAEEEPERPDYPKNPEFRAKFGPRGVLKCVATDTDDPTEDPRFGKIGKQKIEDTGPLTRKRMETVDEEFLGAAMGFIDRNAKASKPFFCWFNTTRMHVFTHLKKESEGKTGLGIEADGMVELDGMVGQLLKQLDDLGIADNTIVLWSTDNGAEQFSWPDGGTTPFRGEKNANWEGRYRVPGMMRWPGVIKPGTEINEIVSHEDWVPTLVTAAGTKKGCPYIEESHPSMEVSNAQRQRSDRTGPNGRRTRRTGYRPDFATALQGNGSPLPISVSRASGSNAPTRTRAVALIRPIRTGRPKVAPDQYDIP